jgi:hypothetical protein
MGCLASWNESLSLYYTKMCFKIPKQVSLSPKQSTLASSRLDNESWTPCPFNRESCMQCPFDDESCILTRQTDRDLICIWYEYLKGIWSGNMEVFIRSLIRSLIELVLKKFDRILTSNPINKISNVWSGCSVLSIMRTVESSWVN